MTARSRSFSPALASQTILVTSFAPASSSGPRFVAATSCGSSSLIRARLRTRAMVSKRAIANSHARSFSGSRKVTSRSIATMKTLCVASLASEGLRSIDDENACSASA